MSLEILENLYATSNSDAQRKKNYLELQDLEHKKNSLHHCQGTPTGKQLNNSTVRAITGGQGTSTAKTSLHEPIFLQKHISDARALFT